MPTLLDYIAETARDGGAGLSLLPDEYAAFVRSFRDTEALNWQPLPEELTFAAPPERLLALIDDALRRDGFDDGRGPNYRLGEVAATLKGEYGIADGWLAQIDPRRLRATRLSLSFQARLTVTAVGEGSVLRVELSRPLFAWVRHLRETLQTQLQAESPPVTPVAHPVPARDQDISAALPGGHAAPPRPGHNQVLGPGQELTGPFTGTLLDYSGCASPDEVADLERRSGDEEKYLPLGYYTFTGDPALRQGQSLYLGTYRTHAPMEFNGTLIVAPQNSGKTRLVLRWALAANRAGYNQFIVDVKGNMYAELQRLGLQGKVYHFSTDPGVSGDGFNILQGVHPSAPDFDNVVEQLVYALLPMREQAHGDQADYWLLRAQWLIAMVHLLKRIETYYERTADLTDLYRLATDERYLYRCLLDVRRVEEGLRANNKPDLVVEPGSDALVPELAMLISPDNAEIAGGQREERYTYAYLMASIALALRPFSPFGTLKHKVRGAGSFSLEELNGAEQVTIILAAREQDASASLPIVSMTVKRLEQILFDRRINEGPHRVLLLLDETRRIRGFNPAEYITFARDAKAGCVLVYQSISQIKEEDITPILENVGTQIYLGSVVGTTAKHFTEILPVRNRPTFQVSDRSTDFEAGGRQRGQETLPYFSTAELYDLRRVAGDWPALVYIKDHPSKKPFLVNMEDGPIMQEILQSDTGGRQQDAEPR